MNISREVITDLLPAYFSGEASADTVALVEEFFKSDPEFARLARADIDPLLREMEPQDQAEELEMEAFKRTKRLLRWRSWLMGLAIFFTLVPFSFSFSSATGVRWVFLGDPAVVAGYLGLGLSFWAAYLLLGFRCRTPGL